MREEKKHGAGDFTNQEDMGIPQVDDMGRIINPHTPEEFPAVGLNDYVNELEGKVQGDHTKGGTGDERINQDSTGDFKDPLDLASQQEEPAEPETQQPQTTNIGPRVGEPVEGEPDDLGRNISGGYQPDEPDLKGLGTYGDEPYEKSEGFPKDNDPEELRKLTNRQNLRGHEGVGDRYPNHPQTPDPPEAYHKDKIKPEDSDPRLPMVDPNKNLNQPQVGQARLDDHPLFEQPTNDPEGIDPSRDRYNQASPTNAMGEEPHDLKNNITQGGGDGNAVPPASGVVGQSDQARLQKEELTGVQGQSELPTIGDPLKDRAEHPDNTDVIDQSGLNLTPGAPSGDIEDPYRDQITGITDPVKGAPDLKNQTIQDPIGEVPQDDGMLVKPEDVQQVQPEQGQQPLDPQQGGIDAPAPNADPNQGTNIDQGVDPNEIDPNQLHLDPESGRMYTDQTDEQGNEVPDLRMDQTPDSDEKQPEVELENEIVTKEEYEQELEGQRASKAPPPPPLPEPPMVSEDQFNAELDKQSIDPNETNMFDNTEPKEPQDRIEKLLNPEEPEEEGWEPAFKEDEEKSEVSKEVADGMRIQSEQVFVNPDGKVIGAPRFYDNRKKKGKENKKKAFEEFQEQEHPRDETGKFAKGSGGVKTDRIKERKHAIRDITDVFPKVFDYDRAGKEAVKAEKLQDKHSKRIEEVKGDLSNKFKNTEVTGRVKTTYSMLEKLARKPEYKSVSDLQDVSGIRTLCKDLKEVGKVTSYVRKNYDVVDEDNYIQKSKGGYRSMHFTVQDKNGLKSEIQVRTPNQDKWANWAHDNFYKPLTPQMKEFIQANYMEINNYAQQMSDYYYNVDQGEDIEIPECPPKVVQVLGCLA